MYYQTAIVQVLVPSVQAAMLESLRREQAEATTRGESPPLPATPLVTPADRN